jgi:hypothetical protein
MRNGGPTYTRLANHRAKLAQTYSKENCSLQKLADRYETSVSAVRFHLEQAGLNPEQPNPTTTDTEFSPSQVSVIQGELLGDGCLYRRDSGRCFFQLSTTTKAHAVRLIEKLPDGLFPASQPTPHTRPNQFTEGDYTCWRITSRTQSLFQEMYEEWYEIRAENNRKIVPDDFTLERTAVLHWYWGDGSCSIRKSGAPRVCFATHGFPEPGVRHLQSEVDRLGYDNYAVEQQNVDDGSGLFIRLRDYDARRFLEDFRPANKLPQYDHKFPVPLRNEE